MIMRGQRDIPVLIRRGKSRYTSLIQSIQHGGINLFFPYPVQQFQKDTILLTVHLLQLYRHVTGCRQRLAMEKISRLVMLFQQHPFVILHHGSQLLQVPDQQQLHPAESLVTVPVTTQHVIHRVQQIRPHHTHLVDHQQVDRLDNIYFFPTELIRETSLPVMRYHIRDTRYIRPERQLEKRVNGHSTRVNRRHARRSHHDHPLRGTLFQVPQKRGLSRSRLSRQEHVHPGIFQEIKRQL